MNEITTYVGIDAHKKDLFVAMLIGDAQTPVTWTVPNAIANDVLDSLSHGNEKSACARTLKRVALWPSPIDPGSPRQSRARESRRQR